jgi:hypothetical protein
MKNSRITLVSLLLANVSINTYAVEAEYTPSSKILTIPTVKIGDGFVYDAELKLNDAGSFDIIGYSETPSSGGDVDAKCTKDKITPEKYNQLESGMTLEQVNTIIGCQGKLDTNPDLLCKVNQSCQERITALTNTSSVFYNWEENEFPLISLAFKNNLVFYKDYFSAN